MVDRSVLPCRIHRGSTDEMNARRMDGPPSYDPRSTCAMI